jgi:hypothetical protein
MKARLLALALVASVAANAILLYAKGRMPPLSAASRVERSLKDCYSLMIERGGKVVVVKGADFDQLRARIKVRSVPPGDGKVGSYWSLYWGGNSTTSKGQIYSSVLQGFYHGDADGSWYFPSYGYLWFDEDFQKELDSLVPPAGNKNRKGAK